MARKEIKTAIRISATAAKVWSVLTSFEEYGEWNPFLISVEGEVKKGNKISINADGMKFSPKVLVFEENKELRWRGKLLLEGLFSGEHLFRIESQEDGTVLFKHEEKFSGVLVGLLAKKLDTETRLGFEMMNQKLKERAED